MSSAPRQTVLISFLQYPPGQGRWAMKQMGIVPRKLKHHPLNKTGDLTFYKMLGTGGGYGYSHKPDFRTYALLTVWKNPGDAREFEKSSDLMQRFKNHTREIYSILLHPLQSRGKWSHREPFQPSTPIHDNPLLVVLTRATLKMRYYIPFWKRVGGVSKSLEEASGLIFTKGVGEWPWIMQATFSVWQSAEHMQEFAHKKGTPHREAIDTTRKKNGFREELYARFQPFETAGTWKGSDPVGEALKKHAPPDHIS